VIGDGHLRDGFAECGGWILAGWGVYALLLWG